jgi:hypothetical protein
MPAGHKADLLVAIPLDIQPAHSWLSYAFSYDREKLGTQVPDLHWIRDRGHKLRVIARHQRWEATHMCREDSSLIELREHSLKLGPFHFTLVRENHLDLAVSKGESLLEIAQHLVEGLLRLVHDQPSAPSMWELPPSKVYNTLKPDCSLCQITIFADLNVWSTAKMMSTYVFWKRSMCDRWLSWWSLMCIARK